MKELSRRVPESIVRGMERACLFESCCWVLRESWILPAVAGVMYWQRSRGCARDPASSLARDCGGFQGVPGRLCSVWCCFACAWCSPHPEDFRRGCYRHVSILFLRVPGKPGCGSCSGAFGIGAILLAIMEDPCPTSSEPTGTPAPVLVLLAVIPLPTPEQIRQASLVPPRHGRGLGGPKRVKEMTAPRRFTFSMESDDEVCLRG